MRVLLIKPDDPNSLYNTSPPLNLGCVGTIFKQLGCEVKIIDTNTKFKPYIPNSKVVTLAKEFEPDIIGIGIMTPRVKCAYELIADLQPLGIPILAGGIHPTLLPEETLNHHVDIVVRGEGEETVKDLVVYFKNRKYLKDILGISYKDTNGKITHNAPRPLIKDLDTLPLLDRTLFDFEAYPANGGIISSRGCPSNCSFCSRYGHWHRTFRTHTVSRIYNEMKQLNYKYGINDFIFEDDAFTVNKKRVIELCSLIKSNDYFNPQWTCNSRVQDMSYDLLKNMKDAGCDHVRYGYESGDPETLLRINKKQNLEQMINSAKWAKELGIKVQANLMIGFPWETKKHLKNNLSFIEKTKPYVYSFSTDGLLRPYPGSEIYNNYREKYGFTDWWLKDRFNTFGMKNNPPLYQTGMFGLFSPNEQMLEINFFNYTRTQKRAIRYFYRKRGEVESNVYLHFPHRPIFTFLYFLSKFLYRFNSKLERKITYPLFLLLKNFWDKLKK